MLILPILSIISLAALVTYLLIERCIFTWGCKMSLRRCAWIQICSLREPVADVVDTIFGFIACAMCALVVMLLKCRLSCV